MATKVFLRRIRRQAKVQGIDIKMKHLEALARFLYSGAPTKEADYMVFLLTRRYENEHTWADAPLELKQTAVHRVFVLWQSLNLNGYKTEEDLMSCLDKSFACLMQIGSSQLEQIFAEIYGLEEKC